MIYMKKIDLNILQTVPQLTIDAELTIEPLAPLSMVAEMPGSYYKTLRYPNKKMLCGVIENILGWHFDLANRKVLHSEIKKARKKQKKEYINNSKGSTYLPLLMEYFDMVEGPQIVFSEICFFDDLWSKAYRRSDAIVHPNGTINIDYEMIPAKGRLKRDNKNPDKVDNNELEKFFKGNIDKYPWYYSSPTTREYISLNGKYIFKLLMDKCLYKMIESELQTNNIGYLGNSEGWINLKIKQL